MSSKPEANHNGVFKALADPTRRRILRLLQGGELSAGDIASHFEMSAPSVSHHLSLLSGAALVRVRRDGARLLYSIDTTVVEDLLSTVLDLFGKTSEITNHDD